MMKKNISEETYTKLIEELTNILLQNPSAYEVQKFLKSQIPRVDFDKTDDTKIDKTGKMETIQIQIILIRERLM
jgi:hypothetical protein